MEKPVYTNVDEFVGLGVAKDTYITQTGEFSKTSQFK